jgi:hypothetical protein
VNTGLDKPELAQHICALLTEYRKIVGIPWNPEMTPHQHQKLMHDASLWWQIIRERLLEYEELPKP